MKSNRKSANISATCALALLLAGCDFFDSADPPVDRTLVTEGAIAGTLYQPALRIVNRYCADCHVQSGHNELQHDAWKFALRLDTYGEWAKAGKVLLERLDPDSLAARNPRPDAMPTLSFPNQPTQAERDTLLDWIRRGSPNSPSGT